MSFPKEIKCETCLDKKYIINRDGNAVNCPHCCIHANKQEKSREEIRKAICEHFTTSLKEGGSMESVFFEFYKILGDAIYDAEQKLM